MNNNPKNYAAENILFLSWHIDTETYQNYLDSRNIKNLMRELVNDTSIVVVSPPKQLLYKFMEKHYHKKINFQKIDSIQNVSLLKESYFITEEQFVFQ